MRTGRYRSLGFALRAAATLVLVLGGTMFVPGSAWADSAADVTAARSEIRPDDPGSVAVAIRKASESAEKKVVIPPGTYRFRPDDGQWHIAVSGLVDLEIDARGATFIWEGRVKGGLRFTQCRNVKLVGATFRRKTPAFAQGTIVAIDALGKSCDVQLDAGYPTDVDDAALFGKRPTACVFDPKLRQWKAETPDFACTHVERIGAGRVRLVCEPSLGDERVDLGDLIVVLGRCAPELRFEDCRAVQVDAVTIQGAGGIGIEEEGGEGGSRYTFTATYGARPEAARVDPLVSGAAGAFASRGVRRGPTIVGCFLEGMSGDGISIQGGYARVDRAEGKDLVVGCLSDQAPVRVDEVVCVYDRDGAPVARATVRTVEALDGTKRVKESVHPAFRNSRVHQFAVTFDQAPAAKSDFLISSPGTCGAGYVARNNSVRNHRGRGMHLGGRDGVVEKNFLDGSKVAAIVLAPDLGANQADYSRNVTIRNNTIRHAGYATIGPRSEIVGALAVAGGRGLGHETIRIDGNTFLRNAGVNLQVEHARDVVVANNRFVDANQAPCRSGRERGIDPEAIVWMADCQRVRFEGNSYKGRGRFGTQVVGVSASAEFEGLRDGMKLDPY